MATKPTEMKFIFSLCLLGLLAACRSKPIIPETTVHIDWLEEEARIHSHNAALNQRWADNCEAIAADDTSAATARVWIKLVTPDLLRQNARAWAARAADFADIASRARAELRSK
jgi:hypothetical protein